jgi:SOS response regulatory protein OraA/RecX
MCKSTIVPNPGDLKGGFAVKDPISQKKYKNTHDNIREFLNELKGTNKMSRNIFNLEKFAQQGAKKKKRGNPFRVLMGKVGKLIDHGLSKRDVVRTLLKENIWNEETIGRATDIVRDYNKKKYKKKHHKEAQTLLNTAEEWGSMEINYSKRSNAELITSVCWLNSVDKFDFKKYSFGKSEIEDKSRIKTKIKEIKSELIKRGMSKEALDNLLK